MNSEGVRVDSVSDEQIVRQVLDGQIDLYEVIMRRYNQRLYRIARAILRDPDEAEDVMQETYFRAYMHLRQYAGEAKFSTWLTRIAVHEALARSNRRRRVVDLPSAMEDDRQIMDSFKSTDPDPEALTSGAEARVLLESAIDSLPEAYRSVFVLREIEGMNTSETAECLNLNEENVRIRLLRSRKMLQAELYARAGVASARAFQFLGPRCDHVVHTVLRRIREEGAGTR